MDMWLTPLCFKLFPIKVHVDFNLDIFEKFRPSLALPCSQFKFQTFWKNSDPPHRFSKVPIQISDFFEKSRPPPMGFQKSEFEFQTFLFCFLPPPLLGKKAEIFPFFNYDASP